MADLCPNCKRGYLWRIFDRRECDRCLYREQSS